MTTIECLNILKRFQCMEAFNVMSCVAFGVGGAEAAELLGRARPLCSQTMTLSNLGLVLASWSCACSGFVPQCECIRLKHESPDYDHPEHRSGCCMGELGLACCLLLAAWVWGLILYLTMPLITTSLLLSLRRCCFELSSIFAY